MLYFPQPHSATGEDVAELQLHGSRAVLAALFEELGRIEGMRPAEAGEFTRRAFENGKLDLTEAEGLDDLIDADTEAQRRQALRQFKGLLGQRAEDWRTQIIEASALVEAGIDFSDEGDVPDESDRAGAREDRAVWPPRSTRRWPGPRGASVCAKGWWWRSPGRPMPASRRCSIASRGARLRSCRLMPARRAT